MTIASLFSAQRNIVTLGVQGVVSDDLGRVLLVKHGYRPGWHFPGGGVERGETAEAALTRELKEEVGVEPLEAPTLWGIYSHFDEFPGDHIVLFLLPRWRQASTPASNFEIQDQGFFGLDALPEDTSPQTCARLWEIEGHTGRSARW
ncbi:MAG: NUDIX domain-containing protein [Hyphomicrobiaceae bacterium]